MDVDTPDKVKILIVDDEAVARKSIEKTLLQENYHCEQAANVEKALKILASNSFDLAILDISMPGKSGLELTSEIISQYPDTAIIMVTIVDEVHMAIYCMKLGAADYLIKPFEPDKLLQSVALALERRNTKLAFRNYQLSLEKMIRREKELKTEFLHSVAHEIKTPLTAIISSSEILGEDSPSDTRHKIADNIKRGAWLLNKKINELTELEKTHARRLESKRQPLQIRAAIREITLLVHDLFKNREQQLKIEMADYMPTVNIGRDEFEQILISLLSNASRFSPNGSRIIIRAKQSDERIVVEVEDTAPVITEEEKKRIYELYYRGNDLDRIKRIPGLGIGLFVAKKMVELYGGAIWINSIPGKGNIFAFSMPILESG